MAWSDLIQRSIRNYAARRARRDFARVRWTANTLVFWDNRCTQHHALWDYYPLARAGHRVSIIGERPAA